MFSELALTTSEALRAMERLLGVAVALQALELLLVRDALSETGVFRWSILRREFAALPWLLRTLLDGVLSYRTFSLLLVLELVAALLLACYPHPLLAPFLLLTTLLVCIRFRGTYNGGADSMTVVLLISLSLSRSSSSPLLARAGLAYAAGQLTLSYCVAGLSKLRDPSWRSGTALTELLSLPQYGARALRASGRLSGRLGLLGCWLVVAFECAFALAWLDARLCLVLLLVAFCFHLANARLLGLNRFVWAWLAAYPALLYWSLRLQA